jgi:hypothetical protein
MPPSARPALARCYAPPLMKGEPTRKEPSKPSSASKPSSSMTWGAAGLALKVLWTAFVITTPVVGAWVASSLAAYANGPVALAAASALLAFPILPLAWEYASERRRRRSKSAKPHVLTFTDRLVLRTLAVNLLFLGLLVGTQPRAAFAALSTRGDWMLDGDQGPTAQSIRIRLFWAADRLEWLYLASHDNPYEDKDDKPPPAPTGQPAPTTSAPPPAPSDRPSPAPSPSDTPSPSPAPSDTPSPAPTSTDKPSADKPPPEKPSSGGAFASTAWPAPVPAELHPAVAAMPKDAEQSIQTVARYIAERDSDPAGRFRAAHDWVADRIAYDAPALAANHFPPQDAETVFRTRTGVCAGYAKLLTALGAALGLEVVYVVGDARTSGDSQEGDSHAWSAVKLGGRYHLADATWDSGTVSGTTFTKHYRTDYLYTPPEVFGTNHFPGDPKWQLREKPISRGDFFRQAMMTPRFHAEGRELLSPQRSQVTISGPFTAEIKTRSGLYTLASWATHREERGTHCKTENGPTTRVTCDLPGKGRYLIRLFSSPQQYGSYDYIGQFDANRE